MKFEYSPRGLAVITVTLIYILTLIGCVARPQKFPQKVPQPLALAPPVFAPAVPLGPNDALRPSNYSFDVTPTGAAIWRMPLWLPQGRNGMQPLIAITYNSTGPSGTLGMGFAITGFSSITRCWSTPAQDGRYSAATGGLPDALCLDGQRMVREGTTNDFRLEMDPGTLVRQQGGQLDLASFEVRFASGRIGRYGFRDQSSKSRVTAKPLRVDGQRSTTPGNTFTTDLLTETLAPTATTIAWNVDREEDRFGNFIEYDYDRVTDPTLPAAVEVVPTEVRWTGYSGFGTAIAPSRRLKFVYASSSKLDPRTGFRGGIAVKQAKLLTSLEVHAAEGLVSDPVKLERPFRTYQLTYLPSSPAALDRLSSIKECVYATATTFQCLDPVTFSWSGTDSPVVPDFMPGKELTDRLDFPIDNSQDRPTFASDVFDSAVGDFDGDGRDDFLYRLPKFINSRFASINGDKQLGIGQWFLRMGTPQGLGTAQSLAGFPETPGGDWKFSPRVVDLDSDGRAEVILYSEPIFPSAGLHKYEAYGLNTCPAGACDFIVRPGVGEITEFPNIMGFPRRSFALQIGDLDGDGRPDLVRENGATLSPGAGGPRGGDSTTLTFRRGTGAATFGPGAVLKDPMGFPAQSNGNVLTRLFDERYVIDLDGNGQSELVTSVYNFPIGGASVRGYPFVFSSITPASSSTTGQATVTQTTLHAKYLENSSVIEAVSTPCVGQQLSTPPNQFTRFFLDVNGDGLADSVAAPSVGLDSCVSITTVNGVNNVNPAPRNLASKLFISINTGAAFRPPVHTQLLASDSVLPTIDGAHFAARRSVDHGARIVDLDGDGRSDIVLTSNGGDPPLRKSMVLLHSNGAGFTARILSIPTTLNFFLDVNFALGGYGPRLSQIGDFNGDGQPDIVHEEPDTKSLQPRFVVYLQKARSPNVVTVFDGGPHTAKVDVTYVRGSVAAQGIYTRGTCVWPQVCLKDLGWVVASHTVEATNFEPNGSTKNVFKHTYADARSDVLGRRYLGVARYTRRMFDDAVVSPTLLVEQVLEFDLDSRTCRVAGSQCTYSMLDRPKRQVQTTPLPGGNSHVTVTQTRRDLGVTGMRYRPQQEIAVVTETEGAGQNPPLLRSSRSTTLFDAFGNPISEKSEVSDVQLSLIGAAPQALSTTWHTSNAEPPDCPAPTPACTKWLVRRYNTWILTSLDPSQAPFEQKKVRTTEVTYEPDAPDVKTITIEPFAPTETEATSGQTLTTTFGRDAQGVVDSVVQSGSAQVRSTTIGFSVNDKDHIFPSTFKNSLNHTESAYPDAVFGMPQAKDNANGMRATFKYDALGRVRLSRPAGGAEVMTTYWSDKSDPGVVGIAKRLRTLTTCRRSLAEGLSCETADPLGRVVRAQKDGFDISVETRFVFDRLGYMISETLPHDVGSGLALTKVLYERDNLGRVVTQSRPGETTASALFTTKVAYEGRLVRATSERGIVTTTEFDVKGRVKRNVTVEPHTQSSPARDVATEIQYWHFDLPRRVIHPPLPTSQAMNPAPAALETLIEYDILGRRESMTDPDTGRVLSRYNAFGELKRSEDANGGATSFFYDAIGRPERVETPTSAAYPSAVANQWAQLDKFFYDSAPNGIGRLARITSNDGIETTLTYDSFGRQDKISVKESSTKYEFSYSYNAIGQLLTLAYPASGGLPFATQFKYAGNGELREVWEAARTELREVGETGKTMPHLIRVPPKLIWQQLSRNAAGQSTEEQFTSSMKTRRVYNAAYQLRLVEGRFLSNQASYQRVRYGWEADGFMASREDLDSIAIERFGHDFLGRLAKWTVYQNSCNAIEWEYGYDDMGNIRSRKKVMGKATLFSRTYDYTLPGDVSRPHGVKRVTESAGSTPLSTAFAYDAVGQLTNGRGKTYTWTPFGLPRRIGDSNNVSTFSYDGLGQRVVQEKRPTTALTTLMRTVTVAGFYELRTTTAGMTREHVYNVFSGDGLIAQVKRRTNPASETVNFIHQDSLGSPDAITTEVVNSQGQRVGQLVERGKYDPFGEKRYPWAIAHPIGQPHSSSIGFTGHEPDDAFGLVNMQGRIYDPVIGRFLSADPLAGTDSQDLNRYSYVGNSPLKFVDPSGYGGERSGSDLPPYSDFEPGSSQHYGLPYDRVPLQSSRPLDAGTPSAAPSSDETSSAAAPNLGLPENPAPSVVSTNQVDDTDEEKENRGKVLNWAINSGPIMAMHGPVDRASGLFNFWGQFFASAYGSAASGLGRLSSAGLRSQLFRTAPRVRPVVPDKVQPIPQAEEAVPAPNAPLYGPYHRFPIDAAELPAVRESGMAGGLAGRNIFTSPFPAVKAWIGRAPPGGRAYEFYTTVRPTNQTPAAPGWALWYEGSPGVISGKINSQDAAFIPIIIKP